MERLIYFYPMSRMEELEAMLEESPDDPFLIYALAREYEAQQNTMQALLMYEHLVTNFPDYIATYFHYAKLLFGAGNRNAAIALLEQGIKAGSQKKEAHQVNEMKSLLASWAYGEEEQ